ncbi:MAG TPA: LptA/OstA family protein [Gammaproteobacteria bacterium]|nr:LptA/OstA family protein [Gammaproteobacteria bacterium]
MSRSIRRGSGILALGLLVLNAESQETTINGLEYSCTEISGNARSNEAVCVGFRFADEMNEISAGRATMSQSDTGGSHWRLTEGVQLLFDTTEIQANEAMLTFETGELVFGELSGNPVVMSDYIEERETPIRGTAQSVSYDNRSGTVRLIGEATLVIGENEVMGCDWIYNFVEKNYSGGGSDNCSGVLFRLAPPEESSDPQGQDESP